MKLRYGKEIRSLSSLRKTTVAQTLAFPYTQHIQKTPKYAILNTPITQNSNTPRFKITKDLITNKKLIRPRDKKKH